MHKIELQGSLCISDDLASRLQMRGLLSSSGGCTEDFILFLQECVARDDSRCSILADKSYSDTSLCSATVINTAVVEDNDESNAPDCEVQSQEDSKQHAAESGSCALQSTLSSLVDESDLVALRQGLNTLYQGG